MSFCNVFGMTVSALEKYDFTFVNCLPHMIDLRLKLADRLNARCFGSGVQSILKSRTISHQLTKTSAMSALTENAPLYI